MEPYFNRRNTASAIRGQLNARGFTLIQMLVVLAIIVVITTIALSGQSVFNRSLTLTNTAYDVALSIRQAETYGISSRAYGTSANTGYGIEFSKTTPTSYVFYADAYPPSGSGSGQCHPTANPTAPDAKPGNCLYDAQYGGSATELVTQYQFGAGITVADFCGIDTTGASHCASASPTDLRSVDIVFVRPNAEAILTAINNSGSSIPLSNATLYLTASGATHCVQVTAVGQVSVPTNCP